MSNPQPREIWWVDNQEVKLHSEEKEGKYARPVLVMCSREIIRYDSAIINIVPLTCSKDVDRFHYPIADAYESKEKGFEPSPYSTAVIQLYQPIRTECFKKLCGIIKSEEYFAIRHLLCLKVIGHPDYDLT